MSEKIVIVDHPVGKRDDRASRMLEDRGYAIDWRRPAAGDALPEPGPDYAAALVFGVLGVHNSVASRTSYGGTAPSEVRKQVARWQEALK